MPEIEIEPVAPNPAPPGDPYATPADVRLILGTIGNRLPPWLDAAKMDEFVELAHGLVVEALAQAYPNGIPTFEGNGLTVVRWAEAKLAGAEILDAIRVNLPAEQHGAADKLRESAYASLAGGVVGYLPGSEAVDDDGDPDTPARLVQEAPRVSSYTPMSAFPDPYEAVRRDTSERSY